MATTPPAFKARHRTISSRSSASRGCTICAVPAYIPVRVVGQELRTHGIHTLIANVDAEAAVGKVCGALLRGEFFLVTVVHDKDEWRRHPSSSKPVRGQRAGQQA
ncbi:MAG: hypothetical protein P4M05_36345 [Bradyrhizobium sp.]|nr:hypothetical protein [Bradyrhizobium sp.]